MALLIFDCDGVLVDSEILHSQIEADMGREILGIERDQREHNSLFCGRGLKEVFLAWEKESGRRLPEGFVEEMARRKNEAFSTMLKPIPYVGEALKELQGLPRCVASGTPLPTLEIELRATKLFDFFAPHLFSSTAVARGKPAPDIFLYAAQQMGVEPEACLVIEDSIHGVAAARAAHMRVIGFVGGSHCLEGHAEKLKDADILLSDMRKLPALVMDFFAGREVDAV